MAVYRTLLQANELGINLSIINMYKLFKKFWAKICKWMIIITNVCTVQVLLRYSFSFIC